MGVWTMSELPGTHLTRAAQQNKRLERTRRSVAFIRSCVGEPLKRSVRRYTVIDEISFADLLGNTVSRAISGRLQNLIYFYDRRQSTSV